MNKRKIGMLFCTAILSANLFMVPVWAENGTLTIQIKNAQETGIAFVKVADMVNGTYVLCSEFEDVDVNLKKCKDAEDLMAASEKLIPFVNNQNTYKIKNGEIIKIENLSPGMYLIYDGNETDQNEVLPSLVSIPMYDQTNGEMTYEIKVNPKVVQTAVAVPQTGDGSNIVLYAALALGGLVTLLLLVFLFILPML